MDISEIIMDRVDNYEIKMDISDIRMDRVDTIFNI